MSPRRVAAVLVAAALTATVGAVPAIQAADPPAFAVKVNFQPAGTPVPAGYVADTGAVYGSRGSGLVFGWNVANGAGARDRNAANSPDQRYDTFNHMQRGGTFSWQLAVPNGEYTVRVVAGDPSFSDSLYRIDVEGSLAVNAAPNSDNRWIDGTTTVTVSDGKLTLGNAAGATNNKIAFLEVIGTSSTTTSSTTASSTSTTTAPPPAFGAKVNFQPPATPVPAGYLADTGEVYGTRSGGLAYGWNAANGANARDRNATNATDQRYDTFNHLQRGGTFVWQLAVPSGNYTVRVVAGDPAFFDSTYRIAVEGVVVVDGTPTTTQRWLEGTKTVTVADGKLTVGSATGAANNKIAFVEVSSSSTSEPPPPPPPGCKTISPLPCPEVLVSAPYLLDFSGNAEKVTDQNGVGTGFTMIDPPSRGTGYVPARLKVTPSVPGTLSVSTTSGLAHAAENSQDNALGVGVDAADQVSLVTATLRNPPAGSGKLEQAGVWFGLDENNCIKLAVLSEATGPRIEMGKEINGVQVNQSRTGTLSLTGSVVALTLRADPATQTVAGSYRLNGGSSVMVGSLSVPSDFFNADGAGIDPTLGTRVFAGIFTSHRNATAALTYTFDDFSLTTETLPPPSPSSFSFTRGSFPVTNPTSMAFGPDGRLYVTELLGKIHAFTLGANHQPVADEVITTIGSRLTLGIAVDPDSTPSNVRLWVSHSDPNLSNNAPINSSVVSRLSGAGFSTREDVISGLPRSKADHSVNAVHFGSDGRLYIAMAGNTGAGAPSTAASAFGDRPEQPLSAAILVADVQAPGFEGDCASPLGSFGPPPCDVRPYATGLRNPYDFVFHSNGSMYAPDNGLGVTGTFPPSASAPCTGAADAASWTVGGHNPGEQPDLLHRIAPGGGGYHGHPNPYRYECVFKDGSYQGVPAAARYVAPVYNFGLHRSPDGIIEYRGNSFGGALRGQLLVANYSQGNDITRLKLSTGGTAVVQAESIAGGFSDPLPLVEGPDGTIYVGEFAGGKVTTLVPSS